MADPGSFVVLSFVGLRFCWLLAVTLVAREEKKKEGGGRKTMTAVVLILF